MEILHLPHTGTGVNMLYEDKYFDLNEYFKLLLPFLIHQKLNF